MLDVLKTKLENLEHELNLAKVNDEKRSEIEKQVEAFRKELLEEAEKECDEKKVNIEAQISLLKELIEIAEKEKDVEIAEEVIEDEPKEEENKENPIPSNPFFRG